MNLTDDQLETIRAVALPIEYGNITIHIGANSHYLELDINKRVRIEKAVETKKTKKRFRLHASNF